VLRQLQHRSTGAQEKASSCPVGQRHLTATTVAQKAVARQVPVKQRKMRVKTQVVLQPVALQVVCQLVMSTVLVQWLPCSCLLIQHTQQQGRVRLHLHPTHIVQPWQGM